MLVDDTLYTTLSRSIMSYATKVDLKTYDKFATNSSVLVSIVVSIPACHAGDQGSIPCRGVLFQKYEINEIYSLRTYLTHNDILLARKARATSFIRSNWTTFRILNDTSALGFLHSRTNLSPFTKDFRGGDHLDEYLTIFRGLALSRPLITNEKYIL